MTLKMIVFIYSFAYKFIFAYMLSIGDIVENSLSKPTRNLDSLKREYQINK